MRVVPPFALLASLARVAAAQCPNGSPPPCAPLIVAAPDPSRIAVFPFHVTTTDSLLGEGVAELIAGELTGAGGPRAVHMGTALRTWRRAGGGLRSPLGHAAEMRAATDLGAGLVLEGSVVGLGQRLTLSAQLVSVPAGTVRRAAPVSGLSDSLPRLIQQLTAAVLVASGAPARDVPLRLSDSPAAVRAYIEGLAHFRRGDFTSAAQAFDRAVASDSLFVRASFMRWLTATWGPGYGSDAERVAAQRSRRYRAALSSDDQVVLDAAFGDLAAKQRAAKAAPESPEVLYFLGDFLYHHAPELGWDSSLTHARAAFERSAALDSQVTVLHHLVEIGLWTRDSALLRRAWNGYDRFVQGADPGLGWLVAERTGDTRLKAELRRRSWPVGTEDDFVRAFGWLWLMIGPVLPPATVEELNEHVGRAITPGLQASLKVLHVYALSLQGRRAAAARAAQAGLPDDAHLLEGISPDLWLAASALIGSAPRSDGSAAVARLRAGPASEPDRDARTTCMVRLWGVLMRDSVVAADSVLRIHGQEACAAILEFLSAPATDRAARLANADSLVRSSNDPVFSWSGLGEVILARYWEAAGNPARALALLRSRILGFPNWSLAESYRAEGRLAAIVGDTTGAIRVYREYLDLRRFADSLLVPQRDSVAAELARLEAVKR
jgi:TolB-like protein